jgi:hypothetical protein
MCCKNVPHEWTQAAIQPDLSIYRTHLDLTVAHARLETRLRERRRTIHHASIADVKTRRMPRALDDVAL